MKLEAEQECLEEQLTKELEEMRAEEEQKAEEVREIERWVEEWRKWEEEEAKATKVFAQREAELLRKQLEEVKKKKADLKRSRPKLEMEVESEKEKEEEKSGESAMMDRDMVWRMKAGRICEECRKGGRKCFWPESSLQAKACHQCSAQKAKYVVAGQGSSEAGPLKKRKVAVDKGKGKAKEVKEAKSEPEFRFQEVVEELRGLRQDLRELQMDFWSTHHIAVQIANQTVDVANDMEDIMKHFVLFVEEQEEEAGNSRNTGGSKNDGEETLQ